MRVLCTHAGRHGDAIWALAATRAIAETLGEKVDFCISKKYGGLAPLIKQQEYIREAWAEDTWEVVESAPISPAEPMLHISAKYDKVIHLSFRGWPMAATLAEGYWQGAREQVAGLHSLDLDRPWIAAPDMAERGSDVAIGFSDNHFELKYGIVQLVTDAFGEEDVSFGFLAAKGSRWEKEAGWYARDWVRTADVLGKSKVFFGCNSALWVLANGLGVRTVIMEPMEDRWNPLFWRDSPRNTLVLGGDGKPTFDSRHCVDALRSALKEESK